MQQFKVQLHSVQDVEEFVGIVTAQSFPVTVSGGSYETSGRGFMEMFCLDLNHPITVSADCSEEEFSRFRQEAWALMVK